MRYKMKHIAYNLLTVILFSCLSSYTFAQDKKLSETFNWKYDVDRDARIILNNYDCDFDITTSNSSTLEFSLEINAESNDPENISTLKEYLNNLEYSHSKTKVELSSKFWDSRTSKSSFGKSNTKMELNNGEKIQLSEFKIKGTLKMPASTSFELNSKYSNINLADINELILDSYDDNIYGSSVSKSTSIKAKYSKMEFTNMKGIDMDIYDTDFTARSADNVSLKSKYSGISIDTAKDLILQSYDDEFDFIETGNIDITTKYSGLRSSSSGIIKANIYDSDLKIKKLSDLNIVTSKYSKYVMDEVTDIRVEVSYDDVFEASYLNSLEVDESKYTDYNIEKLNSGIRIIEGYDDNISIEMTSLSFSFLDFKEKYGNVKINIPESLSFKLDWETKYGKFNIDEEQFETRIHIMDGAEKKYQGFKGEESEGMPYIKVRGYDNTLDIN